MGVADCAGRKSAFAVGAPAVAQGRMPFLDIERSELLQKLRADVRENLIFYQFPVTLGRPGADIAGGFPMVDASAHEVCHRELARLDVL